MCSRNDRAAKAGPSAIPVLLSVAVATAGVMLYVAGRPNAFFTVLCGVVIAASMAVIANEIIRPRRKNPADAITQAMSASARLEELGSTAAAVAHEIRNPLSALDIHAQLLEENLPKGDAGDKAREHLNIIRSETHRLNLIVENFIRFARPRPLHTCPVQMAQHLAHVMRLIESEAGERNIIIDHGDLRTDLPKVIADPNQLEQAFLNVMINALQSMPDGGRLTLSSRVNAGYVECIISNTGPAIPQDVRDSIFDLYFTTKESGSGLGLPIAQKIFGEHNGYITVSSQPVQTSFFLGIPAGEAT
ncbi:MAG: hypothetical protein HQ592_03865 [Planctomycetes bacterium]|nr:hypothetical protein [Planctomycetota bacterium]